MAFKMRCPKCFGLDYSIERDNRTFGAVAQAFELVFHCRCGKQMFGEVLLKEYERQKRDFEATGENGGEVTDASNRELERLRQAKQDKGRGAESEGGDADEEPAQSDEDEPKEDKRWRQRMAALAADDDDDDDDDDTPSPAPSRTRAKKAAPGAKVGDTTAEPAAADPDAASGDEAAPATKPARAPRARAPAKPKAEARAPAPPPEEEEEESESEDDEDDGEHGEESPEVEGGDPTICLWPGCGKVRRPNSKYCSRACSNKNARSRHKQRGRRPSRGKVAVAEP